MNWKWMVLASIESYPVHHDHVDINDYDNYVHRPWIMIHGDDGNHDVGNSDNNRPWYAVEDGHAQVGDGQVNQEVVGQAPHSTVGKHCPQHLDSRDHYNLRIRVSHYLVDIRLAILDTFDHNS